MRLFELVLVVGRDLTAGLADYSDILAVLDKTAAVARMNFAEEFGHKADADLAVGYKCLGCCLLSLLLSG